MKGATPLPQVGVGVAPLAGVVASPYIIVVLIRLAILSWTGGPLFPRPFVSYLEVSLPLPLTPSFSSAPVVRCQLFCAMTIVTPSDAVLPPAPEMGWRTWPAGPKLR